jgi:hypothetical protein
MLAFVAAMFLSIIPLRAQTLYDAYLFDTWIDANAWITLDSNAASLIMPPSNPNGRQITGRSTVTNIGFPFTLAGEEHTKFSVNVYGTLRLGNTQVSTSNSGVTPLNQVSQNMPKIEPFGGRMCMDTSCHIRYTIMGDSGSRVFVVEMRLATYRIPRATLSAQVQLFEATGEVRLVYGPMTGDTLPMALQSGIAASSNDVVFINIAANEALFSEDRISQTNPTGMHPEEGRVYSFTINPNYCPPPGAVSMTNSAPDSTVLSWAGPGTAWRLRIPVLEVDTVLADTVLALRNITPSTTYNGLLQVVCGVGDSSRRVRPFTFTTGCGTVHSLPWEDDFQLFSSDSCWVKPYQSSNYRWRRQAGTTRAFSGDQTTLYNEWLVSPPIILPDTVGITLR